ncbi:undecaprenyl-diphosphate phosphatase [Candidatus Saccharibacteria bacterium]|nr:undecaprenyl-diphosphate phosphatase [Candidatus Saccharibacteria bacterium]
MLYLIALLQGIVEGVTEFLPISSTGHLILTGYLLGFTDERAKTFEVVIQLAAILAVVTIYFQRFLRLVPVQKNNKLGKFNGLNGLKLLLLTTLPALVVGLLLHDFIKDRLFTPLTVAAGLAVGGVVLIVFEKYTPKSTSKTLDQLTTKQALGIGFAQIVSIWPGVSRAASTIVGGSFLGLDRKTAVEYSFFAAVPIMVGATTLDLYKNIGNLSTTDIPLFAVGMITSYIVAIVAIKWLLKIVENHSLAVFGYYRLVLAVIVFLFMVV